MWKDPNAGSATIRVITAVMDGSWDSQLTEETVGEALTEIDPRTLVAHVAGVAAAALMTAAQSHGVTAEELLRGLALASQTPDLGDDGVVNDGQ